MTDTPENDLEGSRLCLWHCTGSGNNVQLVTPESAGLTLLSVQNIHATVENDEI